ncbi:PfkB family carbohydrate kinase [Deinococcus yavapaiensis]|uniref:Fructoselysine 6-kinase n=1 Tax=Deinococcus yavapaiensis KR-236 TaxID=694435 RepID=A0A318RZZ5_9DEIO|nr:PfkB family carbohydrate kinase [Deinococcus yavapaiensis]PYE49974.1 fructoselysine 6-kinase [Deinococcus yavapaiensis KR-236]
MRRLLGLGDNTVDLYLTTGLMYPGGNAVNVAALSARLGETASYLGVVGQDAPGDLVLRALRHEGVDVTRCRQVPGSTSWSKVVHRGTDRTFTGSDLGVSTRWELTLDDFDFVSAHDVTHVSLYSGLNDLLPRIREAAPRLSFDFSSEWTDAHLEDVAPLLDVAFLSAAEHDERGCVELARRVERLGARVVVVTRGEHGALAVTGGEPTFVAAEPADVVDTLGAGDAFIAAFLNVWLDRGDLPSALRAGAREAARNCATLGAFGHGTPITPDGDLVFAEDPGLRNAR